MTTSREPFNPSRACLKGCKEIPLQHLINKVNDWFDLTLQASGRASRRARDFARLLAQPDHVRRGAQNPARFEGFGE